jgi:hypothetical protein
MSGPVWVPRVVNRPNTRSSSPTRSSMVTWMSGIAVRNRVTARLNASGPGGSGGTPGACTW